jgi:hypothetical protein
MLHVEYRAEQRPLTADLSYADVVSETRKLFPTLDATDFVFLHKSTRYWVRSDSDLHNVVSEGIVLTVIPHDEQQVTEEEEDDEDDEEEEEEEDEEEETEEVELKNADSLSHVPLEEEVVGLLPTGERRGIICLPKEKWQRDADVLSCTICGVEFSLFVRRHHCRICGNVFCHQCTNYKLHIDQGIWRVVAVEGVQNRAKPQSNAEEAGKLSQGTRVLALHRVGNWLQHAGGWCITHTETQTFLEPLFEAKPVRACRVCVYTHRPHWTDERDRKACQRCNRKFEFFTRKHHCRLCGEVVCDACSCYKAPLNDGDGVQVRHCFQCWIRYCVKHSAQ